jgi:hypothetical protein
MHGARRDLLLAGGAATILVAALAVPGRLHALLVALATLIALTGGWWIRHAHDRLRLGSGGR